MWRCCCSNKQCHCGFHVKLYFVLLCPFVLPLSCSFLICVLISPPSKLPLANCLPFMVYFLTHYTRLLLPPPSCFHCPFPSSFPFPAPLFLSSSSLHSPCLPPSMLPSKSSLWTRMAGATSQRTCPLPATSGCNTKLLLPCSCLMTLLSMALKSCLCHPSALWKSLTCSASESCDLHVIVM